MFCNRVGWSLLFLILAFDGSLNAQTTFADLEAGYKKNAQRLGNTGIEMVWSTRHVVEPDVEKYLVERLRALEVASELEDDPNDKKRLGAYSYEGSEQWFQRVPQTRQAFWCKDGLQLRYFDGPLEKLPVDSAERYPEKMDDFITSTYHFGDEWLSHSNQISEHGIKSFIVVKFDESEFSIDDAPIGFCSPDGTFRTRSLMDVVFPSRPSELRKTADFSVTVDGNIATIQIQEHPERLTQSIMFGMRIVAEIDMSKGFLPRNIKTSPVMTNQGKLMAGRFADRWLTEIDIEISPFGSAFVPQKITRRQFQTKPAIEGWIAELVVPMDETERMVKLWDRPDPNPLVVFKTITTSIDAKTWSVPNEEFFSFEPPAMANRWTDQRTGKSGGKSNRRKDF